MEISYILPWVELFRKSWWAKWLIDWMFYMLRHKNKTLNAEMSTNMAVLHRQGPWSCGAVCYGRLLPAI